MTKKELRKISLQFRTLSSQMLRVNMQEEINYVEAFYAFINSTPIISSYIHECSKSTYDFKGIFSQKGWNEILTYPSSQEEIVDYGYQLLSYILDGPKNLAFLGRGYTSSNKFKDEIEAFMRKSVEPFVVAIRTFLELKLIDADDHEAETNSTIKTIFLSYCQKDSDIADLIDQKLGVLIEGKATISRDIRDVEFHESFKRFMQSIEQHDFVIMIVSDNYLKSRNCMFEVLEVVKDTRFADKLVYIVLQDEDKKYYKLTPDGNIGADVYSADGQTKYSLFWKQRETELQNQIELLGDPTNAITQIKEKRTVQKILFDIQEFLEFVRDRKGMPLSEHLNNDFSNIIQFMKL